MAPLGGSAGHPGSIARPAIEIIWADETTEAGLIVLWTHHSGGLSRWSFNRAIDNVAQRANVPDFVDPF